MERAVFDIAHHTLQMLAILPVFLFYFSHDTLPAGFSGTVSLPRIPVYIP